MVIYTYNERKAKVWWEQQAEKLQRYKNLKVVHINAEGVDALVERNMDLQCNIQDAEMYLSSPEKEFIISWQIKKD